MLFDQHPAQAGLEERITRQFLHGALKPLRRRTELAQAIEPPSVPPTLWRRQAPGVGRNRREKHPVGRFPALCRKGQLRKFKRTSNWFFRTGCESAQSVNAWSDSAGEWRAARA